jgi:hypothetical protein
MIVLSAFLFAQHNCRSVDVRHMGNLLGKLKMTDKTAYDKMMKTFEKRTGKKHAMQLKSAY